MTDTAKKEIRGIVLFLIFLVMAIVWNGEEAKAAYSTNVSIEMDKEVYRCAIGQELTITAKIVTEEPYEEGVHKYIGYCAILKNGWQQIKSWYIDGGIIQSKFTMPSEQFTTNPGDMYLFTVSVFPVDDFTEGASLYDAIFPVYFLAPSFKLTFNANGGQCDTETGSIIYDCAYGELPTPRRSGYSFQGWYTSTSGGTKITEDTIVTVQGNQTLYARWRANSYTAVLDGNGGICSPLSISVEFDGTYQALKNVAVTPPAGYSFKGWYTSASGGTELTDSSKVTIAADHTIYAQWTPYTYLVSYYANGGSGTPSSQTKTHGTGLQLSSSIPQRNGYRFLGWSTSQNGSVAYQPGQIYTGNSNVNLYAVWEKIEAPSQDQSNSSNQGSTGANQGSQGSTGANQGSQGSTGTSQGSQGDTGTSQGSQNNTGQGGQSSTGSSQSGTDSQGNGGQNTSAANKPASPKKQTIRVKSSISKTYRKNASFSLGAKAKGKLSYKTSNKKVITVSSKGKVTIKGYGNATITVTARATSKYKKAVKKVKISIVPKKQKIVLTSPAKGVLRMRWNKDKTVDSYEIQFSTNSKFRYKTMRRGTTMNEQVIMQDVPRLQSNRYYYARVRSFKRVRGKRIYGPWSAVKKIKIK